MANFLAKEFDAEALTLTGVVETYIADDAYHAARKVLYTRSLKDGGSRLGPTRLTVYCGGKGWVIVPERGESHEGENLSVSRSGRLPV